MRQANFPARGSLACPECQLRATRRLYDIVACENCQVAWTDGTFDEIDNDDIRRKIKFLAKCEWRPFSRMSVATVEAGQCEADIEDRVIGTFSAALVENDRRVDIGATGALALLDDSGELMVVEDMPVLADGPAGRRTVNSALLAETIRRWQPARAWIEFVGARPGEGAV